MYPEVERYVTAVAKINGEYDEQAAIELKTLESALNYTAAREVYRIRISALREIRTSRRAAEWTALKLSTDKVVAWIANNCHDHPDHAATVLKALPADIKTLRRIRVDEGWCSDFTDLLNRAIEAGIVVDDRSQARSLLEGWIADNVGSSYVKEVTAMVNAVIVAEAADYVATGTLPKAEENDEDEDD